MKVMSKVEATKLHCRSLGQGKVGLVRMSFNNMHIGQQEQELQLKRPLNCQTNALHRECFTQVARFRRRIAHGLHLCAIISKPVPH